MMAVQTKGRTYMLVQRKQNHTHLYGSAEPKFHWLGDNIFFRDMLLLGDETSKWKHALIMLHQIRN